MARLALVGDASPALDAVRDALTEAGYAVRGHALDALDEVPVAGPDRVDAIVAAVGPGRAGPIRALAARERLPLIDTDGDVDGVRAARTAHLDAGAPLVAGASWRTVPGDLLAALGAQRLVAPREVHVAYVVPERGGVLAATAPGGRHGLVAHLPGAVLAVVGGTVREEGLAEQRRLAWFPRPLGPHHAVGAPGLEPLGVPSHVAGVSTVRTYAAVTSLRAELLQAAGNLARWEPGRRRLAAWWSRAGADPAAGARWACVTEVAGDGAVVRGWANGRDLDRATAALVAALVPAALATDAPGGVVAPAQLAPPGEILDRAAATGALRWSVARVEGADLPERH